MIPPDDGEVPAVALYKAQLNVNKFRRGEIVDVDPDEFAGPIFRGWLKPYSEGVVTADVDLDDAHDDEDRQDASEATE